MAKKIYLSTEDMSERQRRRWGSFAAKNDLDVLEVANDPGLRSAADGHRSTPRTPTQALRNPWIYADYLERNAASISSRVADSEALQEVALKGADRAAAQIAAGNIGSVRVVPYDLGEADFTQWFQILASPQLLPDGAEARSTYYAPWEAIGAYSHLGNILELYLVPNPSGDWTVWVKYGTP